MEAKRTRAAATRSPKAAVFDLKVEFDRETDGRWIADIPALPGVMVYGRTRKQALTAVEALALRVIADRIEHGEAVPGEVTVSFAALGHRSRDQPGG
jgi:predicted RNase H-like HicB family nuclease